MLHLEFSGCERCGGESIGPGLIIIEAEVWHMGVHYIVLVSLLLCIFETFQNKKLNTYMHIIGSW